MLHHRARDADALALATGERVGAAAREGGEADDAEHIEGTLDVIRRKFTAPRTPWRYVTQTARQDVLHHCQALDQVVFLEHHADAPPHPAQRLAREPDELHALELDLPCARLDQTIDAADQRALAGARRADDRRDAACGDVEVDVVQDGLARDVRFGKVP